MVGKKCCVCDEWRSEKITVALIESGSGPGWDLYACLTPCAQQYAGRPYAPDWLKDDLRKRGLWPPTS